MACRPMPPSEQPRVFISYAREDGAPLAQRLHRDPTDEGFVIWLDVQRLTFQLSNTENTNTTFVTQSSFTACISQKVWPKIRSIK